ncbi:(deoxy)nucleoside triphosphate pyrophosphohydrolase [Erythrobacter sp. F6033]|uniref:NUDIX domain-containing protein n=1 Tax=Erythrobacter sp. F6033 TaxID=2926401 RepID=UPI001FF533AB|nr:(deoxy)nucleoside triphosphate pyrophosphohydrolase [Erythrobacter sp. F6033]MCK0128590.1 (deoxy)nucleoside triphosphate pyrophosphohydrolase [Erythrobacter sp. F6033]
MTGTWLPVVAGALKGRDGTWLMHKRPAEKHHGGLWEFPGGKVEHHEKPTESLIRELHEELGISVNAIDCEPAGFAEGAVSEDGIPIVILLYRIARWDGIPAALEGGEIAWHTPESIRQLKKPPLDCALAAGLFGES